MKNIWKVFRTDFKRISNNVVAIVIIMGLSVIPALYAWFNILSNWNPYGQEATSAMKIAVFSMDEGFEFDKLSFNIGDSVVENLQGNTTIAWQFPESYDLAIEGVYSGDYYAALVIPENFTEEMLSFVGGDIENPQIHYYENSKKNAIATKITSKVRTTVQQSVNTTVIKTLVDTLTKTGGALTGASLADRIDELESEIGICATFINSAIVIGQSSNQMLDTAQDVVPLMENVVKSAQASLDGANASMKSMEQLTKDTTELINNQIDAELDRLDDLEEKLKEYKKKSEQPGTDDSTKQDMKDEAEKELENAQSAAKDTYESLKDLAPEGSNQYYNSLNELLNTLNDLASNMDYDMMISHVQGYKEALEASKTMFNTVAVPMINAKLTAAEVGIETSKGILGSFGNKVAKSETSLAECSNTLEADINELISIKEYLCNLQSGLQLVSQTLDDLENDSKYNEMVSIIDSDASQVSAFITSPVKVKTQTYYEIETYGSAMAPFYTVLALWVGGLILVALIHVKVKKCPEVEGTNECHRFFGRYLVFFFIGQIQTLITVLGDLFYIKIQCLHPLKFWFAAAVMSFMFSFFMYALTVAWGNIGQAIAVIVMVIQVAGAGGTFPIEVLPRAYQAVYRFLPFTYAMNALRECVGGTYLLDYWKDLGVLGLYIVASVFIGLFFGKPFRKMSEMLEDSKKKSKIML